MRGSDPSNGSRPPAQELVHLLRDQRDRGGEAEPTPLPLRPQGHRALLREPNNGPHLRPQRLPLQVRPRGQVPVQLPLQRHQQAGRARAKVQRSGRGCAQGPERQ